MSSLSVIVTTALSIYDAMGEYMGPYFTDGQLATRKAASNEQSPLRRNWS